MPARTRTAPKPKPRPAVGECRHSDGKPVWSGGETRSAYLQRLAAWEAEQEASDPQ